MQEQDAAPHHEDDGSDDGNEPVEDSGSTSVDHNKGNGREQGGDSDSNKGNTARVGFSNNLWSPAILGEVDQHAGGNIEIRVGSGGDRSEDDCIHVVGASTQSSLQENDGERGMGDATVLVEKTNVIVGNDRSKEEDGENIKDSNTNQDSVDSLGDMLVGVARLSCSDSRKFGSTISESDRNKNRKEGLEATLERCSRDAPVLYAISVTADGTTIDKDTTNDEDDDGDNLEN